MCDGGGQLDVFSTVCSCISSDALTTWLLVSVAFVRRGVEEHDGEDVQVPHAVDAGEEGAVHLHCVFSPVPMTLIHLTDDKEDDSHGSTSQSDQHEELEPENQALIVQTSGLGHGRQWSPLTADVAEDLKNHEAKEEEVETGTDPCYNYECHSQLSSYIRSPDAIEGVCQLDTSLTHVEDKEAEWAKHDGSDLLPVHWETVPLCLVLKEKDKIDLKMGYISLNEFTRTDRRHQQL